MNPSKNLKKQIQQNLLAVISIGIAVLALSYNSWRNELSEDNRTVRAAGFEILKESAKLQFFIDATTYASGYKDEDLIQGWVSVNFIISLSALISPEIQTEAQLLKRVWADNATRLANDKSVNKQVSEANSRIVEAVRFHLGELK